jgi:hydroxypyruvate reductase
MSESGKANGNRAREMREQARAIFQFALAEASIPKAFERHLHYTRGVLRVAEDLYDLSAYNRTLVLSIGKAGHTMAEALAAQLGAAASGIVAAPGEIASQVPGFRYFRGGHPTPNAESLRAADAMLKALGNCGERALVIFLLSGGGSSIVERPIDEAITLDDLVATYRALVLSGAPIAEINAIRKHLSAVKGGRLARAAGAAQQVSILVPDVPAAALDALASGPTLPDSTTVEDCYRLAAQYQLVPQFPPSVRALFESRGLKETPKQDDPVFHHARWWPILSNETAEKAASAKASLSSFAVEVDNSCDDQDYARAADYLLERVREQRRRVGQACLISGGEVTVSVPQECGTGGRNQHFALYCAEKIAGENLLVLSAGTDGIDGNSPAAGALADGSTLERARAQGLDAAAALERFDAYPFFKELGDAIETGPTGNNVRDLRILLAW